MNQTISRMETTERFDAFGFDASLVDRTLNALSPYYDRWHRVEASGLEHIPDRGGAIFFGNHAGFNLLDGLMLGIAVRRSAQRHIRPLYHVGSEKVPLFGYLMNNCFGGVIGHPRNIDYLLGKGELVLTYPEGGHSTGKPFAKRRELCPPENFGDGFISAAIRNRVPVIPVATIGCEEALPTLFFSKHLGRRFRFDRDLYPVTPQTLVTRLPSYFGLPLNCFQFAIGFPSKIRVAIGPPVAIDPETPSTEVPNVKRALHSQLQQMIDTLAREGAA